MEYKSDQIILKPKLIVFDLDHTLWPFRVDKNAKSPFSKNKMGKIVDSNACVFKCFPYVRDILQKLKEQGYHLAVASRITNICGAYQLLELFRLSNIFQYKEIYNRTKTEHFHQLREKSGVEYTQMLFFDDDKRNIRDIRKLGVVAVQVHECGINEEVMERGLWQYKVAHC